MYQPGSPPQVSGEAYILGETLFRELRAIATEFDGFDRGKVWQPTYVAPTKPRTGQMAYADGTQWNPGYGEGLYEYRSDGAWHKLSFSPTSTGWVAMTGTADKGTTYAVGTVTLAQLAGRVKAIQDALMAAGVLTA